MTGIVTKQKSRPNYSIILDYRNEIGERKRKWIKTDIPIQGHNKRKANEKLKEVLAEYENKQIGELLKCSQGDPLELLILLTLFYGLRRSEVLGLKWDAVDFDNDTIKIRHTVTRVNKKVHKLDSTKNESSNSVIPMSNFIKSHLKKWKMEQLEYKLLQPNDFNNEGYICTYINGEVFKPDYVSQHFKLLLKKQIGRAHV